MSADLLSPVCDLDCEAAVLSSLLLDPGLLGDVSEILAPEDCYSDANRRIYQTILELDAEGAAIDPTTVASRLRSVGRLEQIGGSAYLLQLCDATPAIVHVEDHARIVADKARQRRATAVCQAYAAAGRVDVGQVDAWLAELERAVYEAATARQEPDAPVTAEELVRANLEELGERARAGKGVAGIETGWPDLTSKLGGWRRGVSYVVAGRPGMGKSALMLQACMRVAAAGELAVFVSAEMPVEQLGERMLAVEGRVDTHRIAGADFRGGEWPKITEAAERIRRWPLHLAFRPGIGIAGVRSLVRREVSRARRTTPNIRLGMVAVDYLQIMGGTRQRGDSRDTELATITRGLATLAGEFDCPVVYGSQLNREVEKRSDKRPQLSDLRECGSIEADAFAILMLYRDDYYHTDSPDSGILEINVAKQRQGPTGKVLTKFTPEYTRIDSLARDEYYQGNDVQWEER